MRYMLDTNICIHIIQQHPPAVIAQLEAKLQGEVVMSVVTFAELRAGLAIRSKNRQRDEHILSLLIDRIPVVPFDQDAARAYGQLRAALPNRNKDAMDRMIAAHATSLDLILVTNNSSDFAGYPGMKLENWVTAS